MALENSKGKEEEEPKIETPPNYEAAKTEEPEKPIELSGLPKTASEEEETPNKLSDIQAVLLNLTPVFKNKRINELVKSAMVSRIFPDNYTDKHFLITASLIEEACANDEDVDVVGIISQVQDALSIGYEGRGIIDRLELAGVAHEEEMEKLSKELGF